MIAEYEYYHGVVLREILVKAPAPVLIRPLLLGRRASNFCLSECVGLHIKHSAKRLPPWKFAFSTDSVEQIEVMASDYQSCWLALVCGRDGVVTIRVEEFRALTGNVREPSPFLRVDRDRNTRYRVYGNQGMLENTKSRGVSAVIADALARKS